MSGISGLQMDTSKMVRFGEKFIKIFFFGGGVLKLNLAGGQDQGVSSQVSRIRVIKKPVPLVFSKHK